MPLSGLQAMGRRQSGLERCREEIQSCEGGDDIAVMDAGSMSGYIRGG